MRAPTRGLAKALRSTYWGGGGGPALPPARSVRPACGVYKTRQAGGSCGLRGNAGTASSSTGPAASWRLPSARRRPHPGGRSIAGTAQQPMYCVCRARADQPIAAEQDAQVRLRKSRDLTSSAKFEPKAFWLLVMKRIRTSKIPTTGTKTQPGRSPCAIEHDFGPIFVIKTPVQKSFQHTAQYVMKFEIHPPLTSPTDIPTDLYALPKDRGPVGGASGRTECHLAVLAPLPCPHGTYTYPQFGSRGGEQGGTCWPTTAAPCRDAKTQVMPYLHRRTAALAHPHSENASSHVRRT
jgi:hypothetical protein